MPPKPQSYQLLYNYISSTMTYIKTCLNAGGEFGSHRHTQMAKQATDAILQRLSQNATLQALDATQIIALFKVDLLPKESRDSLVDAITSKTSFDNHTGIEEIHVDERKQDCDAFYLYLTQGDYERILTGKNQHEILQVLVKRMLSLKMTHCHEKAYAKIASIAIWAAPIHMGNSLEVTRALKRSVECARKGKQREPGTPTNYPDTPGQFAHDHEILF